jgi:hypothetical protein
MSSTQTLRRAVPALALIILAFALFSAPSALAIPDCDATPDAPVCTGDPVPKGGGGTSGSGTTTVSCAGAPALVTASRSDAVGLGQFMTTSATATCSGATINAITRTRATNVYWGFRGCVAFDLFDGGGKLMRRTAPTCFGVDGTLIGVSDRTDAVSQPLTPAEAASLRAIAIIHTQA